MLGPIVKSTMVSIITMAKIYITLFISFLFWNILVLSSTNFPEQAIKTKLSLLQLSKSASDLLVKIGAGFILPQYFAPVPLDRS